MAVENFPGLVMRARKRYARPLKVKGTPERVYYYYYLFFYNSLPLLLFLPSWVFFVFYFSFRDSREKAMSMSYIANRAAIS